MKKTEKVLSNEEINELYAKEFPDNMTWKEAFEKMNTMQSHPYFQELCETYCDKLISVLTDNHIKYDFDVTKEEPCSWFFQCVEKLDESADFLWAFYYFLKREYAECRRKIHDMFMVWKEAETVLGEADIVYAFVIPFKNAFDGFWPFIGDEIKQVETKEGIADFCELMDDFYSSDNDEDMLSCLQHFLQIYPAYRLTNEWIGHIYYAMSMWNNAIAYLERVDHPLFFYEDEIYWMLAWAYGKVRNYAEEEKCYRKCREFYPDKQYLLNNLGYSLYKQKKYSEARSLFEECLEKNIDLPYAANNYVRVLIALGKNDEAKKFIENGSFRVSKPLRDRAEKPDASNARLKKDGLVIADTDENETTGRILINKGVKLQQFSNEKLLEDELTARIESGMPVFDLSLKIYKRHGEYGRQYIIPAGRLDLLCEDGAGNLYVIELKKDSGYDDAYKQLSDYLEWFAKSGKFKDKNVYGIICLNDPSEELIAKVHADKRMKLYEYQISYVQR
ncbi:MAG: endonuclease NucS [Firmicutes bacterium]|nr:endonuclease NucS [Bacillota bacterium]